VRERGALAPAYHGAVPTQSAPRSITAAIAALALGAGCAAPPVPASVPLPPEPVVVEATLGIEPGAGVLAPAGAPRSTRPIEGGAVRITVRAASRPIALIACRAWRRLAEAFAVGDDPTDAWLRAEALRIEREIAPLGRVLSLLPPHAQPPTAIDVVARAMALQMQIKVSGTAPRASDLFIAELPLVRLRDEARADLAMQRAAGTNVPPMAPLPPRERRRLRSSGRRPL
jgi:hypothetical protein